LPKDTSGAERSKGLEKWMTQDSCFEQNWKLASFVRSYFLNHRNLQRSIEATAEQMSKVLIFKETLLPPSETFILSQMNSLKRYQAQLCGLERSKPSLPVNDDDLLLLADSPAALAQIRAKLYRRTGIAPLFHSQARRFRPNLIHAHFASGGRSAMPLARSLRVPLLVTFHGADITVRTAQPDRYAGLADEAACFICISAFIRDRALQAGFPAKKLFVHYIGIDRELFAPSSISMDTRKVLFVGRLVEKKGCEYLIRAMQHVQESERDSELLVVGDGPLRPALQALSEELKVRCRFYGVQPSHAIRKLLQEARVFCVPSVTASDGDSEGLGIVFAEAQAMGVPVVSTLHGGIPEIVSDGETGLLVPERDPAALAEALLTLLRNDSLWNRFHQAAPVHIQRHFDLNTQTALLESLYDEYATSG
jgi:colanic acid/amylovoran biosynthesis glycosyltransferase